MMMLQLLSKIRLPVAHQSRRSISVCCCICQSVTNENKKPQSQRDQENLARIRNIGILAHIDAGKTTTTERMLYYSGKISSMGEVHHGNTVTDYLEQERARGITITSAAVAFPWCNHFINLVDTPGHIDFTVEVENTLTVLDGAVVVLDASAGVEAQTSTVWYQADRYKIPRIVYANKMDRADASIHLCVETLRSKLSAEVLQLHVPLIIDTRFTGVADVIQMQKSIWTKDTISGANFESSPLTERDGALWDEATTMRDALTDQLAMLDDILAEQVLEAGSLGQVPSQALLSTVRRVTILQNDKIYNTRLEKSEQGSKVLSATADETEEVKQVTPGNIAVLAGLKATMTGDLVCESASALSRAKQKMMKLFRINEEEAERELGVGNKIPDPVFFCSVEPSSQAYQNALDNALNRLQREDPSLRVSTNEQTGQVELGGMGELHIDIIRERIKSDYNINADLGPLQIVYKETLLNPITETLSVDQLIGGSKQTCHISLTLVPGTESLRKKDLVKVDESEEAIEHTRQLKHSDVAIVREGVLRAFSHGPKLGGEVVKLSVILHRLVCGKRTSPSIIVTTVSRCVLQALKRGDTRLLEPIMRLEIVLPSELVNRVIGDLHKRRADLKEANARGNNQVLLVDAPLAELLGYSNSLRVLTSGKASFTMEYQRHQEMSSEIEAEAIKRETGFYPIY